MIEKLGKYMTVEEIDPPVPRKTSMYEVSSVRSGARLGIVKWYGAWRQYTFHPTQDTVFNGECLIELTNFLRRINEDHR